MPGCTKKRAGSSKQSAGKSAVHLAQKFEEGVKVCWCRA
jgi:hypothetical protein